MTAILDRAADTTARVREEARQIRPGRAILTLIVGVFWLAGWLARQTVLAVVFACLAVKVGWTEAAQPATDRSNR